MPHTDKSSTHKIIQVAIPNDIFAELTTACTARATPTTDPRAINESVPMSKSAAITEALVDWLERSARRARHHERQFWMPWTTGSNGST